MNLEYRNPRSKISGYYDRPHPKLFKHFDTQIVCRQTAFTKQNFKQWEQVIPFFEQIGKLYKKLAPRHQPLVSLEKAVDSLIDGLISNNINLDNFRNGNFIRLNQLRAHLALNALSEELTWL